MITWRARIYKLREPTPPGPIPDTTGQARNTPEPWGSGPARFQTAPPACYRASWQLPGPDFHRQATTSLRTRRNTTALRHGVTSLFCWAHEKGSLPLAVDHAGPRGALELA